MRYLGIIADIVSLGALLYFAYLVLIATDLIDVENAWDVFIKVWRFPVVPAEISVAKRLLQYLLAESVVQLRQMAIIGGVIIGARLITLAIAYDIRIIYYLNLED
jgi:hypothetical protein